MGKGAAGIRWTKGHATQEHIDQGYSSLADQYGNDRADHLATMAQDGWKIQAANKEYFYTRRTAARAMQRMMVACALARKKAMIRARDDEIAARLGERTGGDDGGADVEEREEGNQGTAMRGMVGEANALRTAFPGAPWEPGTKIGHYNTRLNEFPLMSRKEWGGARRPMVLPNQCCGTGRS